LTNLVDPLELIQAWNDYFERVEAQVNEIHLPSPPQELTVHLKIQP